MVSNILTTIGGIVLATGIVWFFKRNWKDLIAILDELDRADKKEKTD